MREIERASDRAQQQRESERDDDLSPLCLLQTFLAPIHNRKHAKESERERERDSISNRDRVGRRAGRGGSEIMGLETHLYSPSGRPW